MEYRREVDGLRALAVLPVILFHAGFKTFSGGFVGVDVFFVISGYLITGLLLAELEGGRFSVVKFYERRARRILPALFLVMAACLPFAWLWLLPGDMKEFGHSLAAVSVFSSNVLFWRESGYFDTAAELKPLLHTWSLGVEEQFYVLFPLSLMLAWRMGRRWVAVLLMSVTAASLALAQWGALNSPEAAFFLLPTRSWELAIGSLVAVRFAWYSRSTIAPMVSETLSAVGIALIVISIFLFDEATPFPGLFALVPTLGTALVLLFGWPETVVGRMLSTKAMVGIGLVSYSAYLWHQPLFAFARHASLVRPSAPLLLGLSVVAVALAFTSWRFVEQPFRQKGVISRRSVFAFALAGSAAFIVIGAAGHYSDGFLGRYGDEDKDLAGVSRAASGRYVQQRFNELRKRNFDNNDKRLKVLVIGDSFGQDLVNAVYEGKLDRYVQLSTFYIPVGCGNLDLGRDLEDRIAPADREHCSKIGGYEDPRLKALIRAADSVWLVSKWRYWQAELLPQSIANIRRDFGKDALVFGRKSFGSVNLKQLLMTRPDERPRLTNEPDAEQVRTNELMAFTLDSAQFIDLSRIFCGDGKRCRIFDDTGRLLSYDGGHLTPDGARFLGAKLLDEAAIARLVGRSDCLMPTQYPESMPAYSRDSQCRPSNR